MLNLEVVSLCIVTVINFVVVWAITSQSWHVVVNRYFVLAASFVIVWALGALALVAGPTDAIAYAGAIVGILVAPMYIMLFLSLFAALFPSKNGMPFNTINKIFLFVTILFSAFALFVPSVFITEITKQSGVNILVANQPGYAVYMLYFLYAFAVAFSQFIVRMKHYKGSQRQQMIYILVGTGSAAAFSTVTNLALPVAGITDYIWLGPIWTLFYVITVSISIIKHQLFDIKLAVVRTIAYLGVLITLCISNYLLAHVLSLFLLGSQASEAVSSPLNIILALVLVFLFQPIRRFFDKITKDVFYRNDYSNEEFFATLSTLLSSTIELRSLLERASEHIATTLKAENAFFFIYHTESHHMSAGTRGHSKLPLYDARMLDIYVKNSTESIFLTAFLEDTDLRRMLISHKVALVMPLRNAERIVGYLLLGDHRSNVYTKRDMNVLSTTSSELIIAIQNALSLHEVKELNATLQQRIDVATKELRSSNAQLKHIDEVKDEFISMASHQLRTPLTSIKGYLSMVLDGDVGKISPQQERLLSEAFNSSERMVHLIADFLNVSRLQTGKFMIEKAPIDFKQLVEQEVHDLQLMAKGRKLNLELMLPKEDLPMHADAAKLREVVTNFVDNAIYYSKADSTIKITVEHSDESVKFTVKDTGIGVPKTEQSRLFNKFYRASNARKQRPDGTGVGLYLARKVVAAHSGSIIFESIEGQGSTFGFAMPLMKPTQ